MMMLFHCLLDLANAAVHIGWCAAILLDRLMCSGLMMMRDEEMKSRALWSLCIGLNKPRVFSSAQP